MSGMASPITVLTSPYNTINNPNVISLNTRFTPQALREINQTPNYDVVSDPIKPKECIECFESFEGFEDLPTEKIQVENEQNPNATLVTNNLVDTAVYDYLASKDQYYDNKTKMVDNTVPTDPLKSMVKDYLKDNISMYDNRGKFFDQYLFNKKFDDYIDLKNKERLLADRAKQVLCSCGKKILKGNFTTHQKTNLHKKLVNIQKLILLLKMQMAQQHIYKVGPLFIKNIHY